MRLIATSDLHYNIARSKEPAERLARQVSERRDVDALVLIGDLAGADKGPFEQCLDLFRDFPGRKFFVAGNHSLWSRGNQDALWLLEHDLPDRGRRFGFQCLEYEPAVIAPPSTGSGQAVGLAGTVGWYDYSLRNEELAVPMRFYQSKVAPGAARYFSEHRDLLARQDDLQPAHHELTTRWMDGVHVALSISDGEFTKLLADKLARQLDELAPRVDRIVVAIHHVPFANMMPELPDPQWRFVAAYMGSTLFGQVCLAQPKVSHVLCGHTHQPLRARNGPIDCLSIGSNYVEKRIIELEL